MKRASAPDEPGGFDTYQIESRWMWIIFNSFVLGMTEVPFLQVVSLVLSVVLYKVLAPAPKK